MGFLSGCKSYWSTIFSISNIYRNNWSYSFWLMRLQLGFPELAAFMTAEHYYQFVTMHGMIMVVYF